MKTLDEVIELCEKALWCAYLPQDDTTTTAGLALYYLREYREMKDAVALNGEDMQVVNNPPLIWDELKAMEGKPVWVEWKNDKEWMINLGTIYVLDGSLRMSLRSLRDWHFFTEQEMKDGTWQAYREER